MHIHICLFLSNSESLSESESHSVVSNSSDPMDCSPPGSSIHGVFQARVLEWVPLVSNKITERKPTLGN